MISWVKNSPHSERLRPTVKFNIQPSMPSWTSSTSTSSKDKNRSSIK